MAKRSFLEHEFWNPRIFETPYYLYLGWQCLINGLRISDLAKANYALDHGEIGIGSKLQSQLAFDQTRFLPSTLVPGEYSDDAKLQMILDFAAEHDYPLILKSNVGCVGKGVAKINNEAAAREKAPLLLGDFILQKFTPFQYECGIFYTRLAGKPSITGINKKHFPTVVGDGKRTVGELALDHKRHTHHWNAFLKEHDLSQIMEDGQEKRLSFIGSHTLGCKFTDDGYLLTPELEQAVFDVFETQPGFNFGRVDVKADSESALQNGDFVVIEVNGVASLPTHMFDPKFSLLASYKIFLQHGKLLVKIARENKDQAMELLSYREVINRIGENQAMLNEVHEKLMGGEPSLASQA